MRYVTLLAAVGLVLAGTGTASATTLWGSSSPGWGIGGPEIFKVETSSGQVVAGSKWSYTDYNWIMGLADSGNYLYATADKSTEQGSVKLLKIDRCTGAVLSTTDVADLLGTNYSQIHALEYVDGTLYGVENCTWDETYRGNAIVMSLDAGGDVTGAAAGAYVGSAPDGGLEYQDGVFYASSWKSGGNPGESWLATIDAADIGDVAETFDKTLYTTPASGLMSGWQFGPAGDLIGVSWQNAGLYAIDPATGATTTLYSSVSGLSAGHTFSGLDAVVPEPLTMAGLVLGVGSLAGYVRRRKGV